MRSIYFTFCLLAFSLFNCQPEDISRSTTANDTFYVQNNEAAMRVNVKGNTLSNKVVLIIHGGPSSSSYFYRSNEVKNILEPEYAVAYWDQRMAGASQGAGNINKASLSQFGDDLQKVVVVLKHRYGSAVKIYLWSHSWGGMVASEFMTSHNDEALVSGWIFANSLHDWPLNNANTNDKLQRTATEQIAAGNRVSEWQDITNRCNQISAPFGEGENQELNDLATLAMTYIDGFKPLDAFKILRENLIDLRIPLTGFFLNYNNPVIPRLIDEVLNKSYGSSLQQVTIPVLVCSGEHDFITPSETADDFYNRVASTDKQRITFSNSGHNMEEQGAYINAFKEFVKNH
jgi:pimeloyl-ACP methyl ester carboxylesterase